MGSASAIRLTIIGEGGERDGRRRNSRNSEGICCPGNGSDFFFFFFCKSFLINKLMFKNYSNYPSHHIYFKIIKIY